LLDFSATEKGTNYSTAIKKHYYYFSKDDFEDIDYVTKEDFAPEIVRDELTYEEFYPVYN
jgi:hypothetical protein